MSLANASTTAILNSSIAGLECVNRLVRLPVLLRKMLGGRMSGEESVHTSLQPHPVVLLESLVPARVVVKRRHCSLSRSHCTSYAQDTFYHLYELISCFLCVHCAQCHPCTFHSTQQPFMRNGLVQTTERKGHDQRRVLSSCARLSSMA